MNTPYDFKYHAEIQYETESGFMFCNANGNTIDEILWDIDDRLDNIEAAQKLNFQTIHFTDPSLIQELIDPYIR